MKNFLSRSVLLLSAGALALAARAETFKVKITTLPADATVAVTAPTGKAIAPYRNDPRLFVMPFREDKEACVLRVEATDFEPLTKNITRAEIAVLAEEKGVRQLTLVMRRKVRIRFTAAPVEAELDVRDAGGNVLTSKKNTPQEVDFIFLADKLESTTFKVKLARDGYEAVEVDYGLKKFLGATPVSPGVREIKTTLKTMDFLHLDQRLISYDPQKGLVARLKKSRSFRQDTETSGRIPSRIYEIPEGTTVRGLTLSPDGNRLVFSEAEFEAPKQGDDPDTLAIKSCNMKSIRIGEGGVSQLTSSGYRDVDPSFTADDGQHLLFSSNIYRNTAADVLQISSQGKGGIQRIYQDTRGWAALSPSMGADGTIVFALHPNTDDPKIQPEIWSTGGRNKFDTLITKGHSPQISPDGAKILFIASDRNLAIINTDGTKFTQLTTRAKDLLDAMKKKLSLGELATFEKHPDLFAPYAYPTWSPDGRHIIYTSLEATDSTGRPNEDIWMMPADGGSAVQVTTNGSADLAPVMSPDKKTIYFLSNRSNRWAIHRIQVPTP